MLLHFDLNDYFVIGGALLLLVFIAYFLRKRFSKEKRYLNFAVVLTLIVNPLLLICFFAKIFFFTESYPRTVLNSWGYVKAAGTISILCEMMAVYLICLLFQKNPSGSGMKVLTMWFCVNGAGAALCLLEAPKLIWPLSFSSVTAYSLPALIAFALINFAVFLYSVFQFKKMKNS